MAFSIREDEAIAPGLRRIAREQTSVALDSFADVALPLYSKVHSLRISCKAVRGILRLTRPQMGDAFKVEDQRFCAAAKQVAEYRDVNVLAETIASLGGSIDDAEAKRATMPDTVIRDTLKLVARGRDAIDTWPLDIHEFDDIAPGFSHTYGKCLQAWGQVIRNPCDMNFHRLRRMTKYHWFQIRALRELNRRRLQSRAERLDKLQNSLGKAHDLVVLQEYLKSRRNPDEHMLQRAVDRKKRLYEDALKICRGVYARPADDLVADLSCWWLRAR